MEASKLDSLQYDDSYAKEQYYADSCRSDSAGHNKRQRKCKKCGNPMKGQKGVSMNRLMETKIC